MSSLNNFFVFNEWFSCKVKILKIQREIFSRQDKELTKAEYERLLSAAKNKENWRLYLLMQTICSTGIRISELQFVSVEAATAKKAIINCKGKTRQVILPKQLCKMLLKYAKENDIKSGSIFVTKTGKPLDRSNVWKMLKNLCYAANVSKSKVFPHNFRHLFARTYYSLELVAEAECSAYLFDRHRRLGKQNFGFKKHLFVYVLAYRNPHLAPKVFCQRVF